MEQYALKFYTHDGVEVVEGMWVFTNECRWGKVKKVASWPGDHPNEETDPWHDVRYPDDGRSHMFNRHRIASRDYITFTQPPKEGTKDATSPTS